ncbi:MAG TPA: anti-sigma F factor [Candidatus Fimousia stercorigallinarum]|nr:anti-sigma F factor [Candidatus Fimousia stercorigallinarum]
MIRFEFDSRSENEAMARVVIAAYLLREDPTLEEMADIKTAVSEAVTNAIIHGYEDTIGRIVMEADIKDHCLSISITDFGKGIEDVEKAMEPLFTTKPDKERVGMGFAFMEAFMDELYVESEVNKGTKVIMKKRVNQWSKEN